MKVNCITPVTPNPQPVRCKHGLLPEQCAVCDPPKGPRAKAVGRGVKQTRGFSYIGSRDTRPL